MDAYQAIRSLPFPSLASALGIDLTRFKQRPNGEFYGPCPIHKAKSNQTSFSYHPDGRMNCFSCGAKGRGGVDLVMKIRSCGFKAAVEFLGAVQPTVEPPQTQKTPISDSAASGEILKPYSGSYEKFKVACPWLEARCPDAGIREKYGVFAYDNPKRKSAYSGRVMIPVKDDTGILYGYLGRLVTPDKSLQQEQSIPKYLFPKNLPKSRFLFGAAELKAGMFGPVPLKRVWLVESPFCCLKFASLGLPAVSPFGWSVSSEQAELLKPIGKGIVYLPDRNKFEDSNASLSLLSRTFWVRRPPLPAGIDDPELMSREQILAL